MNGTYTQQNLIDFLNSRIGGKGDQLLSKQGILNSAARILVNDIDLRGTKRNAVLAPNLFNDIYDYTLPGDTKKIIDVQAQVDRQELTEWDLVTEEEFDRKKTRLSNLITITDDDMVRRLRISHRVDDKAVILGRMESLNGDGDTWVGYASTGDSDGQAVNDSDVKKDGDDYIKGGASLRFSDNGDTTAVSVGLENAGIDAVDLSGYLARGSVFVRARLTMGDTNITQLTVRLGSDSDNYYSVSDSTTNENLAFQTGWNLVRLDLSGKTTTGTPVDTAIDYVAAFWTKSVNTHLTDTDYAFDHIEVKRGVIHSLLYYSRFVWQTTGTGVYKENSDTTTDTISLYNDEVELLLLKATELASLELGNTEKLTLARQMYTDAKKQYQIDHPSEAKILVSMPYELATVVGTGAGQFNNRLDS